MLLRWLERARITHIGIIIALAAAAPYAASLGNGFVTLDDNYLIYENSNVRELSPTTLKNVFTSYDPQLYIPLTFVSYQLNHVLTGLDPFFFHATNLLLHIGTSILLFSLLARLTRSRPLALFCALLFAVHPLHAEAVLWASARKDVLATFFGLLSTLLHVRFRQEDRPVLRWLSVGSFLLALLSKVSVIVLPLVLLLIDWRTERSIRRKDLIEKIPYAILAIIFAIIAVIGKTYVLGSTDPLQNLLLALKSTVFYPRKILWPDFFSVIYPQVAPVSLARAEFLVPMIVIVATAIASLHLLVTGRLRGIAFGLLWYLLFLAPNLPNFSKNGLLFFASDRYAYLASIGIFLILGSIVRATGARLRVQQGGQARGGSAPALDPEPAGRGMPFDSLRSLRAPFSDAAASGRASSKGDAALVTAGIVLSLLLAPLTMRQAATWKDSIALYTNVIRWYPASAMAQNNLGMEFIDAGRKEEGIAHIRTAMELAPAQSLPYFNLAAMERKAGRVPEALALYRRIAPNLLARELTSPTELKRFFWLGNRFKELGSPQDTLPLLETLAALAPHFVEVHEKLGLEYIERGMKQQALPSLERAVSMGSRDLTIYFHLAELYSDAGRTADLLRVLEQAQILDPDNENVQRALKGLRGH